MGTRRHRPSTALAGVIGADGAPRHGNVEGKPTCPAGCTAPERLTEAVGERDENKAWGPGERVQTSSPESEGPISSKDGRSKPLSACQPPIAFLGS